MFQAIKSYTRSPKITFKDQEDGEVSLLLLRRHFVTNVPWLITSFLLFLTPIVFFLAPYKLIFPFLEQLPGRFFVFFVILWYQFFLSFILVSFSGWFFNIDLVTDRRVLDVDYWGFLFFNVAETPLTNIQDITYSISGLSQTVFNYGNVYIQTAGTLANFEFTAVPNPASVHDLVTDVMQGKDVKTD